MAFDCAFTAKRLGASQVHLFCVEDKGNMCASADDVVMRKPKGSDPQFPVDFQGLERLRKSHGHRIFRDFFLCLTKGAAFGPIRLR